jgi:2-polyprenyl-3-methyl-5-hydroxy-6-metoxy-1,4-benzoquinol methylase
MGDPMIEETRNSDEAEIAALFARLRDEVASREPGASPRRDLARAAAAPPAFARTEAERYWAVTSDRPFLYKPGRWGRVRGLLLVPPKIVLRKLMRWYVEPAFAQQRDFNARVLRVLDELSERIGELKVAIESANQSLAQADRSRVELDERLLRVERRVRHQGPPAGQPVSDQPPPAEEPDYFAFESRMRGSSELIRERQAVYLEKFLDASPVLDIGCGRGEFLTLLRETGVEALGIDLDPDMVAHCRDEGLEVEQADAVVHLSGLDDHSLGGIFCAHVLEHLGAATIFRLLGLAVAKLRPAGLFVAETPNPLSLVALANFSADLSHDRPLHPATLSFLARQAGFKEVTLEFLSEPAEDERLRLVPLPEEPGLSRAQEALDANVNRLNDVVFGPQDYAVIART